MLLAAAAIYLIDRNRELLVGEEADPRIRAAVIRALLKESEVAAPRIRDSRSSARESSCDRRR
jgi:hypothetical protein